MDVVALDDYFNPGQRINVIKMDIQRYELHALRGASRVLADNSKVKLLVEFWPHGLKQAGANGRDLIATLTSRNMVLRRVTKRGLAPFRSESVSEGQDWYVNLFVSSK